MSGRKQHYIPQFLLRGFGQHRKGKLHQVRVTTKDKIFIAPTDGIAASREFYSKIDKNSVTLDDVITSAENEYADIYNSLCVKGPNDHVDPLAISRLLSHLAIRGNHLRDVLLQGCQYTLKQAEKSFSDPELCRQIVGLNGSEPSLSMRQRLDGFYNENKDQIRKLKLSRHEFRKYVFNEATRNWDKHFTQFLPLIQLYCRSFDFDQMITSQHNSILSKTLEPEQRVLTLSKLRWNIIDVNKPLILPDSIAIAGNHSDELVPLAFADSDELQGVVFPLNPGKVVCGGLYVQDYFLDKIIAKFETIAAFNSWHFFISHPSFRPEQHLHKLIGGNLSKKIMSSIETAIQEALMDGIKVSQ